MLERANTLAGFTLNSLDGDVGTVREFYFDDQHWAIRYLVVDTGDWLTGRSVLISPYGLQTINKAARTISVRLTKKQIEDSPSLASHAPVSRQFEETYSAHFGWPAYWNGPFMWGMSDAIQRGAEKWVAPDPGAKAWDVHLRSTNDVRGHHIEGSDGEIGHVDDFLIDDHAWAIRYLVVDTKNWWPGKKVLVSTRWIDRVNWPDSSVVVRLSRSAIAGSPAYTDESLLTRNFETDLHRHHDRPGYWEDEPTALNAFR